QPFVSSVGGDEAGPGVSRSPGAGAGADRAQTVGAAPQADKFALDLSVIGEQGNHAALVRATAAISAAASIWRGHPSIGGAVADELEAASAGLAELAANPATLIDALLAGDRAALSEDFRTAAGEVAQAAARLDDVPFLP